MMPTSENFGISKPCKICEIELDTTNHLLTCLFLKNEVPEVLNLEDDAIKYVYSDNLKESINFVNIFEKVWRKRDELLEKMR